MISTRIAVSVITQIQINPPQEKKIQGVSLGKGELQAHEMPCKFFPRGESSRCSAHRSQGAKNHSDDADFGNVDMGITGAVNEAVKCEFLDQLCPASADTRHPKQGPATARLLRQQLLSSPFAHEAMPVLI